MKIKMFETIKKFFKEEGYEIGMRKNDYEKHVEEKFSEYLTLKFEKDPNTSGYPLHVYFKGAYIGYVLVDLAKKNELDSEGEEYVLKMVSKMVSYREEELEQQRLCNEMEREKLEFMRLRNELLKKKLAERTDMDDLPKSGIHFDDLPRDHMGRLVDM